MKIDKESLSQCKMDRWVNKVAVVTGASAGIGAQVAKDLATLGVIVVGLARRDERVDALKNDLPENVRKNVHGMKCDVTKEAEIVLVFSKIVEKFGGIDILINNAGIGNFHVRLIDPESSSTINDAVQTNILGLINCTRQAFASMKDRKVAGHIINISSMAAHRYLLPPPGLSHFNFNVYPATKHAVKALTEQFRQEVTKEGLGIKVSSISPAIVESEFAEEYQTDIMKKLPHLLPSDISQSVIYILSTPPHVNVQDVLLKPVGSLA